MRFLIVGAGAVGGYFGARLLAAGRDVTFLVRPARAEKLSNHGLAIESSTGHIHIPAPPTILSADLRTPFDVVIVTCKSYDLADAMNSFAAAIGPKSVIIPLLNGMRHLDELDHQFGRERVLGGSCFISTRLEEAGRIVHIGDLHRLVFGERAGGMSKRVEAIATTMSGANFVGAASEHILLEMWEKWVFLAPLAGLTCLMRAAVGDIVAAGGAAIAGSLLAECEAIAVAAGYPPRPDVMQKGLARLTNARSEVTASMLGDVERRSRTEADHILGDLLRRRTNKDDGVYSLLQLVYIAITAWEARVKREQAKE